MNASTKALLIASSVGLAIAYVGVLRPRHLRWGATDEEIARSMLGDEQIERPVVVTNRAVTVDAPPEDVWPWLAQIGELPRGGFYSYEWIERLMGMKVENADRILSDYQDINLGERLDRAGNMIVRAVKLGRALVLGPPPGLWLDTTWAIMVYPAPQGRTRLVSRVRADVKHWTLTALLMMALLDPGQFLMERKFLLEVKKRAEGWRQA